MGDVPLTKSTEDQPRMVCVAYVSFNFSIDLETQVICAIAAHTIC